MYIIVCHTFKTLNIHISYNISI